jgi:polar amino acid transport system substrate-binding protein
MASLFKKLAQHRRSPTGSWRLSPVLLVVFLLMIIPLGGCRATGHEQRSAPETDPPAPSPAAPIQPGDGSDLLDRLLETGVIRVGIRVWPEAAFSPPVFRGFSNAATGGALNGFEVDVARLLAQNLGLELELVEAYPPVIANGDWRGQWDIAIASLVPFDQPAASSVAPLYFSRPYAYMPMGLLAPAAASPGLEQFSGRQIGVLEHSAYQLLLTPEGRSATVQGQPVLAEFPANAQSFVVSNLVKAIHELPGSDRPAALFGPAPVFEQAIQGDLPVSLVPGSDRLGFQPLAVAVVRQDGLKVDRLLAEINRVLDWLDRSGTLAESSFRWYQQDISQKPD